MVTRTGYKSQNTGAGFTLVELLLAVVLVLLLLGAVVFNFSGLQRGAGLEEGVNQVEALLRFARAQAASSGRVVQLMIQPAADQVAGPPLDSVRLLWEPDPNARPGIFEALADGAEYLRGLQDLVRFDRVRFGEAAGQPPSSLDILGPSEETPESKSATLGQVLVNFYPDGSSDSAEIFLASRSEDDHRVIGVELIGTTGSLRRKRVSTEIESPGTDSTNRPILAENIITSNPARGTAQGP